MGAVQRRSTSSMKVLASCDSKYFLDHHKAFYNSALKNEYEPYIHVINPTEEVKTISKNLINISFETVENPTKVYFSCNRFLVLHNFIKPIGVLVTDIDCYFNKPMPLIEQDVGIFLREYENYPGMKVAAGILWIKDTEKGLLFADTFINNLKNEKQQWYADQYALYKTYNELKDTLSFFYFDNNFMDWEFKDDSYMWTGKGDRKYKNTIYLNKKNEYS